MVSLSEDHTFLSSAIPYGRPLPSLENSLAGMTWFGRRRGGKDLKSALSFHTSQPRHPQLDLPLFVSELKHGGTLDSVACVLFINSETTG